jgi:hypothetical protein
VSAPADPLQLVISFAGWCTLRLPTDPDPSDEPRGVSGYTFAFAGEPDLDRVLNLQPRAGVEPRSQSPDLGVRVTSAVRTDGQAVPALFGAEVDLLGNPVLENRNWTLTLPGFEPIVPFDLQIVGRGATLRRDAPLNPADPDQPVWQVSDQLLGAQGARGMEYEPATVGEVTGIWDSLRVVEARLAALQEERRRTTDPTAAVALDGRIAELSFAVQYPTDRRVLARYFVERFGFKLTGQASVESVGLLGGPIDTSTPWAVNFWLGAWDPDLLCLYMNGALTVPYANPTEGQTAAAKADVDRQGGETMALKADKHGAAREARIAEILPLAEATALSELGLTPNELARLQRRIRGKIVVPGVPEYAAARLGNPVYPGTFAPRIVVYCEVPGDVRVCLEAARDHGWRATCRSGAHSSAGFSVNDGMVIDVSRMSYVAVDPHARRAIVGSGTNLGELNSVLDTYGQHVPGGTCDDVGVAGHMMGGGYGFTSRQYGMNCDRVLAVKVMLADGTIVEGSPDVNPDLHWAIRGGTGNQFGVLLDITYELAELRDLWGFCIRWDEEDSAEALAELQNRYMRFGAGDRLGYLAVYTTFAGKPGLAVVGTYNGSAHEGKRELDSLLDVGSATLTIDRMASYASLNDELLAVLPGIPQVAGQNVYEAKQPGYVVEPLGVDGWQQVIDYYRTTPNPYNIVVIEPYGGAIAAHPWEDSAFIHRAVDMDFFVDSFWTGAADGPKREQAEDWLTGYLELVRPWMNGHMYQDYPVRNLPGYRWAYWGDAFPTLLAVKETYDPENFFEFEQSISPAPDGVVSSDAPVRFRGGHIERLGHGA